MKRLFFLGLLVLSVFLTTISCSEEQDFGQFDDLSITPTVASSIFYLESDEAFINSVNTTNVFYSQVFNFDAFTEQFVAERLLEGTISYEFENTTSKRLNIVIEFLDEGGNVLDVETFDIDSLPTLFSREVAYGSTGKSLDILINTSNLRVTASNLSDTISVSSSSEPKITMGSAAEFLFRLK
nr:hypothetical protein [uncultured Allomuricauda sp.]